MIVALLGFCLATAIGAGLGALVFFMTRRRVAQKFAAGLAIFFALGLTVSLTPLFLVSLAKAGTTTLIDLNPREGEKRLSFVGLPKNTTSDFCYRVSVVGTTLLADFQMTEADFLSWMETQNWKAVPFDHGPDERFIPIDLGSKSGFEADSVVYPVRQYESRLPKQVKRGHCFFSSKPNNPDNTIRIIYDRDEKRTYVEHTTY